MRDADRVGFRVAWDEAWGPVPEPLRPVIIGGDFIGVCRSADRAPGGYDSVGIQTVGVAGFEAGEALIPPLAPVVVRSDGRVYVCAEGVAHGRRMPGPPNPVGEWVEVFLCPVVVPR